MNGLDWVVVFLYLGGVVALGLWMGRKEEGLEDYFLAGRRIPWWAALLSMVATEISAATFLGAPEQGFSRNLTYLQFGIGSILARFLLAFLFIGLFYRLRLYTVYEFLAHRFGFPTRNCAAGTFLLGRLFAGGSRLFIASLAVKVVTGFSLAQSILVLGAIAVVYTLFGGIKAVIWTDVVQAIVLIGGAILSIALLVDDIPLGLGEITQFLADNDKFVFFETGGGARALFSNPYHFIPAIFGGLFLTMASHGTDQSMIQRLLTCKDSYRGKLSLVLSGFLGIGVTILFLGVGMLLFVYAATRPEGDSMLTLANELRASGHPDHYYLYYILHGLPAGVSGMLIAAVVAAAMSSIDSELNAMSATFVNDFYKPYVATVKDDEARLLKIAKWGTVAFGVLLIGVGVMIADFYEKNPSTDLLSIALGVMTLFYGALLGIFLLGLLTRARGNTFTNLAGMGGATLLIVLIRYKANLLPALGLVDPAAPGDGFWGTLFQGTLAWPWFIIVGTTVTVAVAALGSTSLQLIERYRSFHSATS